MAASSAAGLRERSVRVTVGPQAPITGQSVPVTRLPSALRAGRFAAVLTAVGAAAVGCSDDRRDAAIHDALLENEQTLVLTIGACNANDNQASVSEDVDSVTASVTTDDPPGGDGCADLVTVHLSAPLGDRQLVDGTSSTPVAVRRNP